MALYWMKKNGFPHYGLFDFSFLADKSSLSTLCWLLLYFVEYLNTDVR